MRVIWQKILKLHGLCNKYEWILILLLIVGLLRIPTLVTPHFYGDEEIYYVMGRAWSSGVPLYEAMFDHKPPLIYVLAGIFPTIALFRGFLLVSMAVHTVVFWMLAQKFWGKNHPWLAKLSSLIFVALSSLPTFEGHIVNAELLMMLPVTLSLLLIWNPNTSATKYLGAGLVAGIGWLYKIPVVFDVVAIALLMIVFTKQSFWESVKSIFSKKFLFYMGGFAIPLALSFAYYYLKGHGTSYLATVFTVNLGYVSSWKSDSFTTFNPFKSGLVVRGSVVLGYTLVLYLLRKKLDKRLLLGALWIGWGLFGALLSYRPYPHYLQEIVPAISLLIPTLFTTQTILGWVIWSVIIGAGVMVQKDVKFGAYDTKPLYQNYWQLITKKISKEEYLNRFDNARRNYNIADFVSTRVEAHEQIYVWGSDPTIYNLLDKVPSGGKYIVSFHVKDLRKFDYVMENLEMNKPNAIIILPGAEEFDALEALLSTQYVEIYQYDGADVYLRVR